MESEEIIKEKKNGIEDKKVEIVGNKEVKKKVYAYYDGSNFYHRISQNYGINNIYFHHLTNHLLDLSKEELVKIKYFNCPVNQQEVPLNYALQLKFFEKLKTTPFLELFLGRLAKRPLKKINVDCSKCGHQQVELINCPKCDKAIKLSETYKSTEKGVDVKLAIHLLLDALNEKYDTALFFSSDADFCPAIKYIIKNLKKEIIYCYFPNPVTDELVQVCSDKRLITKEIVEKSQIGYNKQK